MLHQYINLVYMRIMYYCLFEHIVQSIHYAIATLRHLTGEMYKIPTALTLKQTTAHIYLFLHFCITLYQYFY
jgi:hypothetical protein